MARPRLLTALSTAFRGKSADQLEREADELRAELRDYRRAAGLFREDMSGLAELPALARQRFAALVDRYAATLTDPSRLLDQRPTLGAAVFADDLIRAYAFGGFDGTLVEEIQRHVARSDAFTRRTRGEFESKVAEIRGEIAKHEGELERRRIAADKAAAERELAALEDRIGAA